MARPVTLFTGQWADLPLEELAPLAKEMGYDGLELACWGDHFEVNKALEDDDYVERKREILERNGLERFAVGNHLVGQAVCDPIDERHRATLPQHVWADGDPEGVRRRAAEEMKNTARAAVRLGVNVVTGFTGSSVWHKLYFFPPTSQEEVDEGYRDFAERWNPILDVFDEEGCASRSRFTQPRSHTTSTPRIGRWRLSLAARLSASTSIPATSTGSSSIP